MLILLLKEGVLGNMDTLIVKNPEKPTMQKIVKYFGQIAKAMDILHSNNLIHCGIKPSNIFMDEHMSPMLGEMYKVEVDSARDNQQMFSKMLIAEAMPKVLIYWAPELLKGEKYTEKADIWSFGITCYEVLDNADLHGRSSI
jgi:eukaryotic-like serine/threonine-protein kinase